MEMNYEEMADVAVVYAKKNGIILDFSEESIEQVDHILENFYEHLDQFDGEEGASVLWDIAVHFGIYLGETMLKTQLKGKGYGWCLDDGVPILKNGNNMEISPITKAHKRILYGPEDNVKVFCDVVFSMANGHIPTKNVRRVLDANLSTGERIENVLSKDIDNLIMLVEEGKIDFLILESHDGYFQFYGVDDQFVAEIRVNLANKDFRTYAIVNQEKAQLLERVQLTTPYGQFNPREREVVSLELIKTVTKKYYENMNEEDLLKEIPYVDTTDEMKKCMGLLT